MLFNSISFLCFFPVVVGIYFLVPKKARYLWLLFASYYFYMSQNPGFALLLLLTTVITYASGLMLSVLSRKGKPKSDRLKKWVVFGSVFANLGILFFCKYIPFHLLVPVGISFYTFQALSYTIDVYWKKLDAEKNFSDMRFMYRFFRRYCRARSSGQQISCHSLRRLRRRSFGMRSGLQMDCFLCCGAIF